jgi:hypothetical protein
MAWHVRGAHEKRSKGGGGCQVILSIILDDVQYLRLKSKEGKEKLTCWITSEEIGRQNGN